MKKINNQAMNIMNITFSDGTTETFKVDKKNSEVEEGFYLLRDENENIIVEINLNFIKIIRWD